MVQHQKAPKYDRARGGRGGWGPWGRGGGGQGVAGEDGGRGVEAVAGGLGPCGAAGGSPRAAPVRAAFSTARVDSAPGIARAPTSGSKTPPSSSGIAPGWVPRRGKVRPLPQGLEAKG